jgi:hypothetical protein
LQAPKEEMEDILKEGCKIPRAGMKDRQKGSLVTGSKEDINRFPEDGEIGQEEVEDEVMNLSLHILFNEHEHVLTVDEQKIVLRDNNGMLREKTLKESKGCIEEDGKEETDKENSIQDITTGPEETMRNGKQGDNQEAKDKFVENDKKYAQQKDEEKEVVCARNKESDDKCNQ